MHPTVKAAWISGLCVIIAAGATFILTKRFGTPDCPPCDSAHTREILFPVTEKTYITVDNKSSTPTYIMIADNTGDLYWVDHYVAGGYSQIDPKSKRMFPVSRYGIYHIYDNGEQSDSILVVGDGNNTVFELSDIVNESLYKN